MTYIICEPCVGTMDRGCVDVCPVDCIYRDEFLNRVAIDYDTCIGCRKCIDVCPFGAMGFDAMANKVIKCDFCDGDPQCVRFCEVDAIRFADVSEVSSQRQYAAAEKLAEVLPKPGNP